MSNSIVVFASNYVGARTVEYLVASSYEVVAVVTDSSDPGGFNTEIERLARAAATQIPLFNADDLERREVLEELEGSTPKLGVLAWWPRILKGPIRSMPRLGWLNFHPSLLPYNRGRNPNFWSLAQGTPTGVTLHFIDDGVDSGPIAAQAIVDTVWQDTGETVYLRCRERILQLFRDNIEGILTERVERRPQDPGAGSTHKAPEMPVASMIDLDAPTTARNVLNLIRAKMFDPHPPAQFSDAGRTYGVRVVITDMTNDE